MTVSAFTEIMISTEEQRRTFFKMVYGPIASGWACIAYKEHASNNFVSNWFLYPDQLEELLTTIDNNSHKLAHFYFSVALYQTSGSRERHNVKCCPNIWADLDECHPDLLLVPPSITVQTSPGRYQAFWLLQEPVSAFDAEDVARRISYFHRDHGADSGWDSPRVLRTPYTPNYKYGTHGEAPIVSVIRANPSLFRISDFQEYPNIAAHEFLENKEIPNNSGEDAKSVINRFRSILPAQFYPLFYEAPSEDIPESKWSGVLWRLMSFCLEAGMSREETFVVAGAAKCNKFARDGRGERALWQDVQRLYVKQIEKMRTAPTTNTEIPELISQEETILVQSKPTFIERYMQWARDLTDAPMQYHQAGAFVILSALLSGNIYLQTSHERYYPNLWFMILASTTLTRKSTAMRIAMNLLREVDDRAEMATDGSVEGLLTGLRDRPGQPSIFLRDEITGLLDQIANKDYMSGLAEQLTKLYDGDCIKRLLRKEVIEVKNPRFIVFAGGIKDRTQMLLTEEQVNSGFIPRFIFVSADADPKNMKLTSPNRTDDQEARELLKNELFDIFNQYVRRGNFVKGGQNIGSVPTEVEATMTPQGWRRYNQFESQMMEAALSTGLNHLIPIHVRLTVSTLKAAMLIAASRNRDEHLLIDEIDILHAIYYSQRWRTYASEIVNGIGKSFDERLIDRIKQYVSNSPNGVSRAELMTIFRLNTRRASLLFGTMLERNLIYELNQGGGQRRYRAAGVK